MTDSVQPISALTVEPGGFSPPVNVKRDEYTSFVDGGVDHVRIAVEAVGSVAINGTAGADVRVPVKHGYNRIPVTVSVGSESKTVCHVKVIRRADIPRWRQVATDRAFKACDSAGELVFQNHMWLFGGYTPEVVSDIWRSTDGLAWERMPDLPCDSGVNIPIRFVYDDQMWITSNAGRFFRSRDGKAWDLVSEAFPFGKRHAAGSVVFNGRMWIIGGAGNDRKCNDVWSSTDGVNWKLELEHAPWSPRQLHDNVVVFNNRIWVIGGGIQNYHPFRAYTDVWSSPDGIHWDQHTDDAPWPARIWASCVVYRNRLWLIGGFRAEPAFQNFDDVWYSADGSTWHRFHAHPIWSPRHEISPYVYKDKLWLVAGNAWPLMNDVWQLDIPGMSFVTEPVVEDFPGVQHTYRAHADFHASCGPVTYRMTQGPHWLAIDANTGCLRGISPDAGEYPITLAASDEKGGEHAIQKYTLTIR